MNDLLGDPLRFNSLPPLTRAVRYYELGDREPAGSAERAQWYALAAEAARAGAANRERNAHAQLRLRERRADNIAAIRAQQVQRA